MPKSAPKRFTSAVGSASIALAMEEDCVAFAFISTNKPRHHHLNLSAKLSSNGDSCILSEFLPLRVSFPAKSGPDSRENSFTSQALTKNRHSCQCVNMGQARESRKPGSNLRKGEEPPAGPLPPLPSLPALGGLANRNAGTRLVTRSSNPSISATE